MTCIWPFRSNDTVSNTFYDKRVDFDFVIVNFPFLDGDIHRSTPYGVYTSQPIRCARESSPVAVQHLQFTVNSETS